MGVNGSKFQSAGVLKGAYAPPLKGVAKPKPLDPALEKKYNIVVPKGKGGGDKMYVTILGNEVGIRIPEKLTLPDGGSRAIKPGDKFLYTYRERSRVICSTLPTLPGAVIIESKPMVYSNCSKAMLRWRINDQKEQTTMAKEIGGLMQEAQELLMQQTVEVGCNAVLGINSNVTTDSSGSDGNSKLIIVTLTGTPCVVTAAENLPVVAAKASLVPEYY